MPCSVAGCANAHKASTANWNVGQLCNQHYTNFSNLYVNGALPNGAVGIVDDMVKVHLLFRENTLLCRNSILALENELTAAAAAAFLHESRFAKVGAKGANYTKLSRALEFYEGYCWFPANRIILTGILSAQAFYQSQRRGFSKDPGAGAAHGDQTHRLQWHVLLRLMTNNFTTPSYAFGGWNHTPLALFYEFVAGYGVQVNAWPKAMDAQANPAWANPDNVHADIVGNPGNLYPRVSGALNRRGQKMGGPTTANPVAGAINPSPRDQAIMNSYILVRHNTNNSKLPVMPPANEFENVRLQIYAWEKYKAALPQFTLDPLKLLAKRVYDHLVNPANAIAGGGAGAAHMGFSNTYTKKSENFLRRDDAPDRTDIDAGRIAASTGGFNPAYVYTALTGARPVAPARW